MKRNKFFQQIFCVVIALGLTLSSATAQIAWGGTPTVEVDTLTGGLITATYQPRSPIDLYRVVVMQKNSVGNWDIGGQYYVGDTTWVYDNTLPDSLSQLIVIPLDSAGQEQPSQSQVSRAFRLSPKGPPIIITIVVDREAAPTCPLTGETPSAIAGALASPENITIMYDGASHSLTAYSTALTNHPQGTTISLQLKMARDCSSPEDIIRKGQTTQSSFNTQVSASNNLLFLKAKITDIIKAAQIQCADARMPISNATVILRAE